MRECWTKDPGALDLDKMSIQVTVSLRPGGIPFDVQPSSDEPGRIAANPRLRVFFERARRAILDSKCSPLPLPADKQGPNEKLTFVFKP